MLKLDQITKKFHIGTPDETTLFNQFCFEVQKGEFRLHRRLQWLW